MADSKKDTAKKTTNNQPDSKYTKEELLNASEAAFGVRRHVLAGALHDVTGHITKAEAEKKLQAFQKKAVEKTRRG